MLSLDHGLFIRFVPGSLSGSLSAGHFLRLSRLAPGQALLTKRSGVGKQLARPESVLWNSPDVCAPPSKGGGRPGDGGLTNDRVLTNDPVSTNDLFSKDRHRRRERVRVR